MFLCSFLYYIPDLLYGSVLSLVLLHTRIFYCLFLDNESSISRVFMHTSVCLMLIEALQLKAFVSKFRDLKTISMPFKNWQPCFILLSIICCDVVFVYVFRCV